MAKEPKQPKKTKQPSQQTLTSDEDSVWKDLLDNYLVEFMEFFFPDAHSKIDWQRGFKFLDKELQKVVRESDAKRRSVDKLVQVWLKDGTESWVLLHIEIQGQWTEDFAERMFIYQYRIFDRYRHKVASFILFSDDNPNWQPNKFSYELLGAELIWHYNTIKVLNYKSQWTELEQNLNPFSIVVMAHLKFQETRNNFNERYQWKWILIKMLYKRGYSKKDILELFRFLDWILILPKELEDQLNLDIDEFERSNSMPYITTWERRGIEKGLQQGLQQGLQDGESNLLIHMLKRRFGQLSDELTSKVKSLPIPELESLGEAIFDFQSLSDLELWLKGKQL
jgi:predicted transposase YdaD